MPVTHITGNALDFPENTNVLAHGCNRLGSFGAGFARQIADKFPTAAEADRAAFENKENQLGTFSSAIVPDGTKRVVNLYTQETIGTDRRRVDYEALYTSLSSLRDVLEDAGREGRHYRLALPWVGCGLAGGAKPIVRAMIEDIFGQSSIPVFVVEFGKTPAAPPPPETFSYEMRARPPSIGTHPTNGLISHTEGGDRHGFLLYDRALTEDEIRDFELRVPQAPAALPTEVFHHEIHPKPLDTPETIL